MRAAFPCGHAGCLMPGQPHPLFPCKLKQCAVASTSRRSGRGGRFGGGGGRRGCSGLLCVRGAPPPLSLYHARPVPYMQPVACLLRTTAWSCPGIPGAVRALRYGGVLVRVRVLHHKVFARVWVMHACLPACVRAFAGWLVACWLHGCGAYGPHVRPARSAGRGLHVAFARWASLSDIAISLMRRLACFHLLHCRHSVV